MTDRKSAPEIFQLPLTELPPDMAPADATPGTPEFEQAVIMAYALKYADRGWQALVTVDDRFVRVVAIPEHGMDPREYVLGLLQNGFLEDALPILQALDGMFEDAEMAYNLGICLSELGQVAECIESRNAAPGSRPSTPTPGWPGRGPHSPGPGFGSLVRPREGSRARARQSPSGENPRRNHTLQQTKSTA